MVFKAGPTDAPGTGGASGNCMTPYCAVGGVEPG